MRTSNISSPKGDTWLNTLPIVDKNGAPYDLTGADVVMTVKDVTDRSDDDASAHFQLVIDDGLTIADPMSGVVDVEISDERTDMLTADRTYAYDVQVRKGGQTFTPIGGQFSITRDVTRL